MLSFWPLVFILLTSLRLAYSELVNATIDDQYPDPVTGAQVAYTPDGGWEYGQITSCKDCPSRPHPLQAWNNTWHTNTYTSNIGTVKPAAPPKALITFTGSAVYVYCILSFFDSNATQTYMTFSIDEQQVGYYQFEASGGDVYAYDVLVYANDTLDMGNHTLTIQNGRPDGRQYLMFLDYITFTTKGDRFLNQPASAISTTTQSSKPSKIKVLTGVLVVICILFAIVLAVLLYRLFATKARRSKKADVEVLHTSTGETGRPSVWGWINRYLSSNTKTRRIAFEPSLFVAGRPRLQSEGTKDLTLSQVPASRQRQSQPILAEDEPETQPRGRWAFVMSWRDRAVGEAEIPSLPPTSHAPTTVFSGPTFGLGEVHPLNSSRTPQQQKAPATLRTQPRRGFTVMNT